MTKPSLADFDFPRLISSSPGGVHAQMTSFVGILEGQGRSGLPSFTCQASFCQAFRSMHGGRWLGMTAASHVRAHVPGPHAPFFLKYHVSTLSYIGFLFPK